MKHKLLLIAFLFLIAPSLRAQSPTTQGTDFWVAFLYNIDDSPDELKLIVAGKNCSGVVSNPLTGYEQHFQVVKDTITNVVIPISECYPTIVGRTLHRGLHVVTTDTVSLYASNFMANTFDITNVLPTNTLADNYMIQTYGAVSGRSEFAIVAVQDSTLVDIFPSSSSNDGSLRAGVDTTILLNAGQVYMQFSDASDLGFSGTRIEAHDCRPIALFEGNICTYIPYTAQACDHIYEQAVPTAYWGRRFVVTSSMLRSKDRVRVTALRDQCSLAINRVNVTTLSAGQTYEYEQDSSQSAVYLETSCPAAVYLYFTGGDYGGDTGDPSMVLINPIEQRMDEVTFGTFTTESTDAHFVNIVTQTSDAPSVTLDGVSIASKFRIVPSKPNYSFARVAIDHGSHTLRSNQGGFVAHVYGLGWYESYSYSVGSNAIPLNQMLYVNEVPVSSLEGPAHACQNDTVSFRLESDAEILSSRWFFGDGLSDTGLTFSHVYHRAGEYLLKGSIEYSFARCGGNLFDSVSYPITINPSYTISRDEDTCIGVFDWMDSSYTQSGTYHFDLLTSHGCDSILELRLHMHNLAHAAISSVPSYADDLHSSIRLSDIGSGAVSRHWYIESADQIAKVFSYDYPLDKDSIDVMLVVAGADDCPDTAHYNLRRERLRLWAPNIITPNLDHNNAFRIYGHDILQLEVLIYDRQGRLIARLQDINDAWNATTSDGTPVPQGVYRYTVRYTSAFEPARIYSYQGSITVAR